MQGNKPVTLHLFVNKKVYTKLRPQNKGTYAHPWTLKELRKKSKTDSKIERTYRSVRHYIKEL